MMDASKFIKNGNRARLFSTYKSSQIEQRLLLTTLSSIAAKSISLRVTDFFTKIISTSYYSSDYPLPHHNPRALDMT